ncbi:MAG: hypothetical protein H6895_05875 [Defluviimonas sp.]|uniref:TadE/TadG family type IV pilus assembly protein n=1 Tax=Albidovulum sp. TaxID=1872424 RepID=UPI001D969643|nr:hypothetical protein [Paracoccaceae bacterium]MCC0063606.1 hypothetical protein [Defluviimonas sp.]
MSILSRFRLAGRRFADETRGSMPIEGVIASIFVLWWYVASFQIFNAFQQKNTNLKGAYTIADIISRQPEGTPVDAAYIEGLNTVFQYITRATQPTWLRVSSVIWNDADAENKVAWSYGTGAMLGYDDTTLQTKANRIPTMPEGDSIILVETFMDYQPMFNVGINAQWYRTFIATRPRFASCVAYDKHDGSTPACIYDASIDSSNNSHSDQTNADAPSDIDIPPIN